jgi:hypothetical protein
MRAQTTLSFVMAAALAALAASGCAADSGDDATDAADDEAVGMTSEELAKAGAVKVVQCNPYFAGAYAFPDRAKAPRDWSTAEALSRAMKRAKSEGSVIGMEEVLSIEEAEKVRGILGPSWMFRHWTVVKNGHHALGVAIFYRSDLHDLVKDFGRLDVDHIDSATFGAASYPVIWGGALLRDKRSGKSFGVFTGKLVWAAQKKHGKGIDEDSARVAEIGRVERWIDENMAPHAGATRIITMDQNDDRGSPPWRALSRHYDDGGATKDTWTSPAHKSYRYDYVFWDDQTEKARRARHLPAPYTSSKLTSDHQLVTADVALR